MLSVRLRLKSIPPTTAGASRGAPRTITPRPRKPGPSCSSFTAPNWPSALLGGLRLPSLHFSDQLAIDCLGAFIRGPVGHSARIVDEGRTRLEQVEGQHEVDIRADEQVGGGKMVGGKIIAA